MNKIAYLDGVPLEINDDETIDENIVDTSDEITSDVN